MPTFPKLKYLRIFPKHDFIFSEIPRGGIYSDKMNTILIFSPNFGNLGFWLFRVIFHEFLHFIFVKIRWNRGHYLIHQPQIRKLIS